MVNVGAAFADKHIKSVTVGSASELVWVVIIAEPTQTCELSDVIGTDG